MPTDLITGGSGFIGRHLVAALQARGTRVRVLDLTPPGDLAADIEFVPGSILDAECLDGAMANVRRVYHVAGIAKLWSRDRSDFDRVNAGGTATVLRAAAAHRIERVVHCSTEAILLPKRRGADRLIDETVQPALSDMPGPYTRSKLTAEQSVLAAVEGGMDALIVNPTVPIGPGDRNLTPPAAMLSMFLNGQSPAYLDCTLNLVDVRDVAAGMVLAAERGRTGERYILGGDNVALRDALGLAGADIGPSDAETRGARLAGARVGCGYGVGGRRSDRAHAGGDARGCQAGAAVGPVRQSEGAQRTRLCAAAASGCIERCGGVAVGDGRSSGQTLDRGFDFAEKLAEIVHPEAVAEQLLASAQRAKSFGGVAREARHRK